MSTKSRQARSLEQRQIEEFFQRLELCLNVAEHESVVASAIKFTRHDGYTYSVKIGDKKLIIKCELQDIVKEEKK